MQLLLFLLGFVVAIQQTTADDNDVECTTAAERSPDLYTQHPMRTQRITLEADKDWEGASFPLPSNPKWLTMGYPLFTRENNRTKLIKTPAHIELELVWANRDMLNALLIVARDKYEQVSTRIPLENIIRMPMESFTCNARLEGWTIEGNVSSNWFKTYPVYMLRFPLPEGDEKRAKFIQRITDCESSWNFQCSLVSKVVHGLKRCKNVEMNPCGRLWA